jgi:hypothetical protein
MRRQGYLVVVLLTTLSSPYLTLDADALLRPGDKPTAVFTPVYMTPKTAASSTQSTR